MPKWLYMRVYASCPAVIIFALCPCLSVRMLGNESKLQVDGTTDGSALLACRGLLACAGETTGDAVVPDSNRSQFFITLDATQQLDRKHTIFGKVTGETVFNLTDLSDLEVKPIFERVHC